MPTKRQKEKAERNAQRFIRLILKAWQVQTVEELPEAARVALMEQVELKRKRFD